MQSRKRIFLLGSGISQSLSPEIQNTALEHLGVDANYSLLDVNPNALDDTVNKLLNSSDVIGFNVTAPFKEAIIPYLTQIDSISKKVGAVNTVMFSKEALGYNTDCDGVDLTIEKLGFRKDTAENLKAVVLGAGGAARACIYSLGEEFGFSSAVVLNRTLERGKRLARDFQDIIPEIQAQPLRTENISKEMKDTDLLVNTIPAHANLAIDFKNAKPEMKVFDLGYGASELLQKAAQRGCKGIDGLPMLIEQAARSVEIWFGREAPREAMMERALRALKERRAK